MYSLLILIIEILDFLKNENVFDPRPHIRVFNHGFVFVLKVIQPITFSSNCDKMIRTESRSVLNVPEKNIF